MTADIVKLKALVERLRATPICHDSTYDLRLEAAARIEELERERDDARAHENMARATYDPMATYRAEAAEKRVAELQAALRPFADVADFFASETSGFADTDELRLFAENMDVLLFEIELGKFREARKALGDQS